MASKLLEKPRVKRRSFKRNTLIMYHGGGYNGCMWEWNIAYVNESGDFYSIYHSGYRGCETLEKLQEAYLVHRELMASNLIPSDRRYYSDHFLVYNFASKRARRKFAREAPVDWLLAVARWFQEGNYTVDLVGKCDNCKCEMNLVDGDVFGVNAECAGGIEIHNRNLYCYECTCSKTCCRCGEFYSVTLLDVETGFCEYCLSEYKKENHED